MTKLIKLFEGIIYDKPYDTHGFFEVKEVRDCHGSDLEEMVTKIIKENGSDALVAFQRGVKHGKIDLLIPAFDFWRGCFRLSIPNRRTRVQRRLYGCVH